MLKSIFAQKLVFSRRNSAAPFEDINSVDGIISSLKPERIASKYNPSMGRAKGKIIIPLIEAIMAYCDMDDTPEAGALGITLNNAYVAEYPSGEMVHLIKAECKKNIWQFRASVVRKDAVSLGGASLYSFSSYKMRGQAMFFVMMPTVVTPELTRLDSAKSISLYLPPNGREPIVLRLDNSGMFSSWILEKIIPTADIRSSPPLLYFYR